MSNRYSTPQAFKTALEERLRTEAAKTGTDMGRLRQLLVFDRCLARLSAVFKDAIILKGGLALELRLEQARTTKDIDLRIVGNLNQTLLRLQEAGQMDLGDYLTFEIQAHADQPEIDGPGTIYGGQRFWAQAYMTGKIYAGPFGIDVAVAEPIVGLPDTVLGSTFLEFAGIEPVTLRIYPLETHIAEKIHAYTMPRAGSPNSRVKDLPDIALLASIRPISSKTLRSAIKQTFNHRQTH